MRHKSRDSPMRLGERYGEVEYRSGWQSYTTVAWFKR